MTAPGSPPRRWSFVAIVLILLAAAALRLVALPDAPPGMTHDEADHGLTAWGIVNGARDIYFPIGYGREPLYDYATALLMAGTGPTILAARLTSVYFSLVMIAAVYAWARRAFGGPVALMTAVGLAAGFWPVMAGRQALRSIALPALFSLAVVAYWWAVAVGGGRRTTDHRPRPEGDRRSVVFHALAGVLLGLTFYTYIPARVLWLVLPLLAAYLIASGVPAGRVARGTALTLLVAAAVAAPLLLFLAANPDLEVRVGELSAPLAAAAGGDFGPLGANAAAALRLFTVEGDQTWRYNIPGRPFLPFPLSWLFYAGLAVAGWLALRSVRQQGTTRYADDTDSETLNSVQSAKPHLASSAGAFLALVWLGLGFAPVLVTGPGLATTQAIGLLPVLYLFPALALAAIYEAVNSRTALSPALVRRLSSAAALALFTWLAFTTTRAYFGRWANNPEVRVQYETTMVTALRYLDERGRGAAAVSTITPGPFHTPAVALLTLHNPAVRPRWFDGRRSLLLPGEPQSTLIVPGFTLLPDALRPYLATATLVDEIPMRPDDLDRPIRVYSLDERALAALPPAGEQLPARFGEYLELLGYELSTTSARPGETVSLVTAWRLLRPLPGAALFAHVLGPASAGPLAQADDLGAPGESWVAGDVLLQLHEIVLPADAPPGTYALAAGVYTLPDRARLPVGSGDMLTLTTLTIAE